MWLDNITVPISSPSELFFSASPTVFSQRSPFQWPCLLPLCVLTTMTFEAPPTHQDIYPVLTVFPWPLPTHLGPLLLVRSPSLPLPFTPQTLVKAILCLPTMMILLAKLGTPQRLSPINRALSKRPSTLATLVNPTTSGSQNEGQNNANSSGANNNNNRDAMAATRTPITATKRQQQQL